jgi:hypothetical protein
MDSSISFQTPKGDRLGNNNNNNNNLDFTKHLKVAIQFGASQFFAIITAVCY